MTRDEELNAINEAIAAGKLHRITREEALEYTLRQALTASAASSAHIRRINAAVGNAMSHLKREKTYVEEGIAAP